MGKRKPISKKIRFEVFKRDNFTCQYCGRSAPDVLLHVDHINPVANGGDNNILNLVTSCSDCNGGKGAKLLSDNSIITKQRKQLEEINERRVQLELMLQWREELEKEYEWQIDKADDLLRRNAVFKGKPIPQDKPIPLIFRAELKRLIKAFGLIEVMDALDVAKGQYANEIAICIGKLGGICYNRRKARELGVKSYYGNQESG